MYVCVYTICGPKIGFVASGSACFPPLLLSIFLGSGGRGGFSDRFSHHPRRPSTPPPTLPLSPCCRDTHLNLEIASSVRRWWAVNWTKQKKVMADGPPTAIILQKGLRQASARARANNKHAFLRFFHRPKNVVRRAQEPPRHAQEPAEKFIILFYFFERQNWTITIPHYVCTYTHTRKTSQRNG